MKIVFMGSAEFGLPALEMLLKQHEVAAVVSTPAKPKGRGLKLFDSPVTEFAKSRGIDNVLTPENLKDSEFISRLTSIQADLFVVVAFRILPKDVYSIPKYGTVNIHASLLPKYRGAAPIHRAIEAGERETGVTVFRIDEGVDTGEIILQKKISIGDSETTPELYERLSAMGAGALREAVDGLTGGNVSTSIQNQSEATRAPKLTRQEGHIDWKLSSTQIFNKIRAFKPFPGTYFFLGGKRINAEWAGPVDADSNTNNPGAVITAKNDCIDVQCGSGTLRITKVKPEGRPSMDVRAFLLGHSIAEGTVLE
ncbi:MAG: methionyl-tRNA formyltransferase [Chitinispirillia bacterium]|nr:methionyl-tRNA formyltransferase [Chitinispirillia bacterium]MCL2242543.1 methionyl-tRNA formyltransferase [Chitinispirillia bacterium]